jgi:hypothetical protein
MRQRYTMRVATRARLHGGDASAASGSRLTDSTSKTINCFLKNIVWKWFKIPRTMPSGSACERVGGFPGLIITEILY